MEDLLLQDLVLDLVTDREMLDTRVTPIDMVKTYGSTVLTTTREEFLPEVDPTKCQSFSTLAQNRLPRKTWKSFTKMVESTNSRCLEPPKSCRRRAEDLHQARSLKLNLVDGWVSRTSSPRIVLLKEVVVSCLKF